MSLQVEFRARAFPRGEHNLSIEHLINLTAFEPLKTKTEFTSDNSIQSEPPRRRILGFR
jgi:hypothetical protein